MYFLIREFQSLVRYNVGILKFVRLHIGFLLGRPCRGLRFRVKHLTDGGTAGLPALVRRRLPILSTVAIDLIFCQFSVLVNDLPLN